MESRSRRALERELKSSGISYDDSIFSSETVNAMSSLQTLESTTHSESYEQMQIEGNKEEQE